MVSTALGEYFEGKPETYEIFKVVERRIDACGPSEVEVKSQISFGVNRMFAWFWLYNVTRKNPNGVLHLMLAIDHQVDDPHVRDTSQIGKNRWNHQIVVRTTDDARSQWLGDLIKRAYAYAAA